MLIVYFSLSVLLPLALAMLITFRRWTNGWVLSSVIAFTFFGTIYAGFNSPWFLNSHWVLAALSIYVLAAVFFGLTRLAAVSWQRPSIPGFGLAVPLFAGSVYFASLAVS